MIGMPSGLRDGSRANCWIVLISSAQALPSSPTGGHAPPPERI
jgi:hypothetical protein